MDPAAAVDPAVSLSTYSTLPMEVGRWPHWPRRAESTTAVDNGEAKEGDEAEPGKTQQWMPTRRGVRGFTGSLWTEAVVAVE